MSRYMENWKVKFTLIWTGQAISLLTSSILQMAIVWYLTEKTGSAAVLSAATFIGFLPQALLGTFIGVYIDRYNRKMIMVLADLFIAAVSLALVAAGVWGEIPIPLIFAVLFLRSIGAAFHYPALQAITPSIVPQNQLTRFAGYSQSFENISMVISPALAALLFGLFKLNVIILLDVVGALAAVLLLGIVQIPSADRKELPPLNVWKETLAGLEILKRERGMLALMLVGALYAIIYFPVGTLYPLISMTYFGGGVSGSGLVEMVFAAGSLLGSLLLGVVGERIGKSKAIAGSIAIYGAGVLVTGLLPPTGFWIFAALSLFMGMSVPFYTGVQTAIFQLRIPEDYLGRVFSLSSSISTISMPLGLIISGVFAELLGVETWFLVLGVLTLFLAAFTVFQPSLRDCCGS